MRIRMDKVSAGPERTGYVQIPTVTVLLVIVASAIYGTLLPASAQTTAPVSFQNQVMPIFEKYCVSCHSPGGVGHIAAGLDLTNYRELRSGSVGGVALVPYHSDRSPMMRYLKDNWTSNSPNALKMPPVGPQLSAIDLKTISDWIDQGAKNN
jgi:hypothetical protein